MHDAVRAPTVEGNRPRVGMTSPIRIDQHSATVNAHAEQLPETQIETWCGPAAIIVIADLRAGFIPDTRVVGSRKRDVDASTGRAINRRDKLKIAAAGAAIKRCSRWIADTVSRIIGRPVIAIAPTVTLQNGLRRHSGHEGFSRARTVGALECSDGTAIVVSSCNAPFTIAPRAVTFGRAERHRREVARRYLPCADGREVQVSLDAGTNYHRRSSTDPGSFSGYSKQARHERLKLAV